MPGLEPGIQAAPSVIIRGRGPWVHGSSPCMTKTESAALISGRRLSRRPHADPQRPRRGIRLARRCDGRASKRHLGRNPHRPCVKLASTGWGAAHRRSRIGTARARRRGPLLLADRAARIELSGLVLDADHSLGGDRGLIDFSNVGEAAIFDYAIERSGGFGLRLRACDQNLPRAIRVTSSVTTAASRSRRTRPSTAT